MTPLIHPRAASSFFSAFFLLDKPQGLTSNAALTRVKRFFGVKKAGHAGTLDPMATGMLPIALGEATKGLRFLLDADKRYLFNVHLGVATDTGDAEGKPVQQQASPALSEEVVRAVLPSFLGPQMQVPPMYSALKHEGKRLYDLARSGQTVPRAARSIVISSLCFHALTKDTLTLEASVSKGTYIRVLGEDIAKALGTVGHLSRLRRLSVAGFDAPSMCSLEALQAMDVDEARVQHALALDAPLRHLPCLHLTAVASTCLRFGKRVAGIQAPSAPFVRLYDDQGDYMGIGSVSDEQVLRAVRLLSTAP
jgi:tRNA pseudouridine55 synthase